jgi:hypothetical protein
VTRPAILSLFLCAASLPAAAGAQTQPATPAQPTAPPAASSAHPPVVFTPRFTPGEVLRYQLSFRSQSHSAVGGAIENPQGASEIGISVGMTLRLEVLTPVPVADQPPAAGAPAAAASPGERPPLRLRAVYESVTAKLSGDSYDPASAKLLAQYQGLQGHAIEFQLGPHAELEYIEGLSDALKDPRALEAARNWLEGVAAGPGAPAAGASPGESWRRNQAVGDAPLKNTTLESISTYLRDEPCDVDDPAGEQCAVVLMRFSLGQKSGEKNATPEAFRRNHLRTSGQWTSDGESLIHVSLSTGRTVSVSQSSDELMDLDIRHEDGIGLPFHYAGRTKTETHLLLLPAQSP